MRRISEGIIKHRVARVAAVAALAAVALSGCIVSDPKAGQVATSGAGLTSARAVRGLSYGPAAEQVLDLYLPLRAVHAVTPVIVFVHGGNWSGGDRVTDLREYGAPLTAMLARGWAVASIDYRLSTSHPDPAQVDDVSRALRWIRAHAGTYGLDRGTVVLAGHSSGGHLAMLVGTAWDVVGGNLPVSLARQSGRPDGVVALAPVTDLVSYTFTGPAQRDGVSALLGCAPGVLCNGPRIEWLSPMEHLDTGDPALYLAHGTWDSITTFATQAAPAFEAYERVLGSAAVWFDVVEKANHDLPGVNAAAVADFLDRVRTGAI